MLRVLLAVSVILCLTGCASSGDPDDRGARADPPTGWTSQAVGTPWDGTVSTRSPVNDNTEVSTTSTIGKVGTVASSDAGFCWITSISGSFRGTGEYAGIVTDANGYYKAIAKSNTTYDSVTGVGPAVSVRCRHLTDFIALAHVGDFSASNPFISGAPPAGGPNYGQSTTAMAAGDMYPWAGLQGRLNSATTATWMISAMDHGSDTAFARWAYSCPLGSSADCQMLTSAWRLTSASHTWTYSSTGASTTNTNDIQLVTASGQECYVDGVWGYWTSTTSAKVETHADGYWHLVTAKGSAALGIGAYASCFPLSQGF